MTISLHPLSGIPEVSPGDDLAALLAAALEPLHPVPGDILVVTHKVVSKAEGAVADLRDDAAYRALVESEAVEILRRRGDLVIARTRHGFICANAGVDRSNVPGTRAVLLPDRPDRSAHTIRTRLEQAAAVSLSVVVTDTFGRPWRRGLTDVAIGPDGAMYFTVGGRGTQSELYRVTYVGDQPTDPAIVNDMKFAELRALRQQLERFHANPHADGKALEMIWSNLDHEDRHIRYAARVALEHQPASRWQARVFREEDPQTLISASVALARQGNKSMQGDFVCQTTWSEKTGSETKVESLPEAMEPMRAMVEPQLKQQIDQLVVNRFCHDEFTMMDHCHVEMKEGSEDTIVLTGFEGEYLDRAFFS